ncbi:PepSY domain-containing protein [Mesorhizobium sp. BAC0120]|uniref:PepSY domain-containing protein n=1 Tax=Mesorhizobium sp. BAC0120 TaxID=3090670 RepID=UPI00298CC43B|nr:PepSY domain-containing protein [Mesorhizobium sp. BAC0120]MDW6024784.1 PepSY domain-containing protein [Mesorhizobium sp. BAC0120]
MATKVGSMCCGIALVLATAAFCFAEDQHQDRHRSAERARRGAESGEFLPLAEIVAGVRERYPGEIVETELESEGSRPYYEFHILLEGGHLIEVKVDARNGRYMALKADDD